MNLTSLLPALLALISLYPTSTLSLGGAKKGKPKDAILLSSVKTLTLRANAKTSGRRLSPIPQLTCKGPGCKYHTVDIMRCTNQGSDYNTEDIQWSCVANLPEEVKLGSTDVICEGYKDRDDEFVLKGSCGVEYRLVLTEKGEEKHGSGFWSGKSGSEESGFPAWLFMAVFFGVFAWILYSMYQSYRAGPAGRQPRRQGGGNWGGWGGGGGDDNDPPPPYPGYPRSKPSFAAPGRQGWQPGFWSGVAGGAAAGYMAGNRGNRQPEPVQRPNSWFGGGNSGAGPSRTRSSGSSSGSGARYESTGFGSTSRR